MPILGPFLTGQQRAVAEMGRQTYHRHSDHRGTALFINSSGLETLTICEQEFKRVSVLQMGFAGIAVGAAMVSHFGCESSDHCEKQKYERQHFLH